MTRDTIKDEAYFNMYLSEQETRIGKFLSIAKNKAEKSDTTGAKKAYMFVADMLKDKLFAAYSVGFGVSDVKAIFEQWIDICGKSSTLTYSTLLNIASLAILLRPANEILSTIKRLLSEYKEEDVLLNGFHSFLDGKGFSNESHIFKFENNYGGLRKVFESADKTVQIERLAEYANKEWYNSQSDSSWYNSHLGKNDTYVGYWAFECAALAVALSLDVSKLKGIEFIPSDLL